MLRNSALAQAVTALDEKLRREVKRHLFWSKFMGSITSGGEDPTNNPDVRPSGAVIDVNNGLKEKIGDRMLIPMLLELAGVGRLGDAVLLGHEEDMGRKFANIHYNQLRHAVTLRKGKKDYSNEEMLRIAEYAMPEIAWWFAQRENWEIITAFYEGVGEMLSTSATDATFGEGLELDKRWHPNMYTWAGSTPALTRLGTTDKFPTAAQVNTGAGSTSNPLTFTTATVRAMRTLCYSTLYMKPLFTVGSQKYWGVLISPKQAATLMADSQFTANQGNPIAYGSVKDHPLVNGSIGFYGNFVFFEDPVAVRGFNYTGNIGNVLGTVAATYDDTTKTNPRFLPMTGNVEISSKPNEMALIFGAGALGKAVHTPLGYEFEKLDYSNWKGLAGNTMYGYERLDYVPESQIGYLESTVESCTPVYNRSSAVIMTWQ